MVCMSRHSALTIPGGLPGSFTCFSVFPLYCVCRIDYLCLLYDLDLLYVLDDLCLFSFHHIHFFVFVHYPYVCMYRTRCHVLHTYTFVYTVFSRAPLETTTFFFSRAHNICTLRPPNDENFKTRVLLSSVNRPYFFPSDFTSREKCTRDIWAAAPKNSCVTHQSEMIFALDVMAKQISKSELIIWLCLINGIFFRRNQCHAYEGKTNRTVIKKKKKMNHDWH